MKFQTKIPYPSKLNYLFITLLAFLIVFSLQSVSFAQVKEDHESHDHGDHENEEEKDHDDHGDDDDHDDHGHDDHAGHDEDDGDHDDHGEEGHGDEHGGPIQLTPQDMIDFGIELSTASPGEIHDELRLQGEVRMNENTMGHISPRYDGVVTKINKRLAETVKAGDVLAEMESNETLRPFQLIAPIDGTIVSFHITPGESLPSGEVAYTLADTSSVWVDLRVYQRDLPKVHGGQKVAISAGHEYPQTEGEISYVGPVIDETSRTGFARVILANPEGTYRPGLFVIGNVLLDAHQVPLVVPRSGIISMEGKSVVFVEAEEEEGFEAREVTIGQTDSLNVEILSGLRAGERYVSKGGFFLKADSQTEDFGDGHAH